MKKKILKYLSSKESQSFSHLDNILKMYLDGVLNELLLKYGYTDIEIFPAINKNSKAIQVNFKYHNIVTTIDFMED